jgi:hypothetical protein
MGPQMNANTRKCKAHQFFVGAYVADEACVKGRNNKQYPNHYSRSFACISGLK